MDTKLNVTDLVYPGHFYDKVKFLLSLSKQRQREDNTSQRFLELSL